MPSNGKQVEVQGMGFKKLILTKNGFFLGFLT